MEVYEIVLIVIFSFLGFLLLLLLAKDIARVFWFVRYYHLPQADPTKVANYRKRMEDAYYRRDNEHDTEPNPFSHIVTDEEFENNLIEFEKEMNQKGASNSSSIFSSLDESYMKLLREAIGVVIAPRAVLFQVAHPFVAVGIRQHSNVVRDTPKRFQKTYFHMFRMAFGTREQAIKSARLLRKTHNRVFGKFDHNIGKILKEGETYTAAHTHALLWVGLALAESVTYGYQALVGSFTEKEKDELAKDAGYGLMLFGVPKSLATGTYEEFRIAIEACWQSDIITVSPEALEIIQHLLYPKKWYLKPVFAIARYITKVILPDRYALEFFGSKANLCDQIVVSVLGGIIRFGYRLIPGPLRYVPEYSQAVRRVGSTPSACWACDPCAKCMEAYMRWAKEFFMDLVLPAPSKKDIDNYNEHNNNKAQRKTQEGVSAFASSTHTPLAAYTVHESTTPTF